MFQSSIKSIITLYINVWENSVLWTSSFDNSLSSFAVYFVTQIFIIAIEFVFQKFKFKTDGTILRKSEGYVLKTFVIWKSLW